MGLGYVFSLAVLVSLGMKLDCSPIVYPAVAGSTKPILGQASALLKGYLFFNCRGLGAALCTSLLEEGATLLPEWPSGDEKGRNSGGRESVFESCWLCLVRCTQVTGVLEAT